MFSYGHLFQTLSRIWDFRFRRHNYAVSIARFDTMYFLTISSQISLISERVYLPTPLQRVFHKQPLISIFYLLSNIVNQNILIHTQNTISFPTRWSYKCNNTNVTHFNTMIMTHVKDGLSFKIKNHLYLKATPYLLNYALVEDLDTWYWFYILITYTEIVNNKTG